MARTLAFIVFLAVLLIGAAPASASSVSNVTVDNTSPSNGAGAKTHYTVPFTTSATGGLSAAAGSTITVTFPTGTGFTGYGGGDVFVGATRIGSCQSPNLTTRQITCSLFGTNAIGASSTAHLEFTGITNPGTAATNYALTVVTSADTDPVSSANYTVLDAHALSGVTVTNTSPSNGAGAKTHYTVPFTTSATGGLSTSAQSTITVTFPTGTGFTGYGGGDVFVGATRIGSCQSPNLSTLQITCGLFGTNTIAANSTAQLEFVGITNPAAGNYTLTVVTSSDQSATSTSYTVAAAHTLTSVSATPASSAQSATTQYTVTFTTSSTGGLSTTAQSTMTVTFPNGTGFGSYGGGDVFVGTTRIGTCQSPVLATRQITCGLFGANTIAANGTARLVFTGITNPSAPGNYTATVATSSDTAAVTSGQYGIAQDTTAPETSVVSGPPATTTNAQPTFTFSSTEPGSTFQCSLDGGAFAACTSPFVAPPLAAGVHTFSVRSTDPAGNTDATPASQTFTVTTTQPTQPPQPTAGKTVVVSEAAGTVLVKAKGSNKFVALNADEGIPLGSTVDTTHGTVELTSQQKGGAAQTAKFFDGIFLVTQTGSTINLKLTQKLAKCASGKAASAAKKRPKRRRLWGDGKGHFRTQGKHSAATVVGTKWMVQDSCAGTLTKVARGIVSVRDFTRKKTVKVKAGKKYLAKAP